MELDAPGGEVVDVQGNDAAAVRASIEDPEQFEAIFDRYHRRVWSYLARLGGRECADDLAGEVFVAAFTRRDRYDPDRGLVASWLFGIASNLARTRFRRQARAARAFARVAARLRVENAASTDAVDDALGSQQELARVRRALDRLSITDREIIVLHVWEGLTYEAIADALGIKIGTVRSRLARARGRLRELSAVNGELTVDG